MLFMDEGGRASLREGGVLKRRADMNRACRHLVLFPWRRGENVRRKRRKEGSRRTADLILIWPKSSDIMILKS